ncbi:uncharacterized protein [Antedon mediterranea]|uniref:uncharacterized protein n=1 Tax=Antedon mediterranea TaxID=105859 RepID=UPI003AF9C4CC
MENNGADGAKQSDFLMEVTVRYRSEQVARQTVRGVDGVCVYHGSNKVKNEVMTAIGLKRSRYVDYRTPQKSEKLIELTDRVLLNMKNGITFTYDPSDNCVYATRLCNSMVFMYSPQFQTGPEYPVKLILGQKTKIYDCTVHGISACSLTDEKMFPEDPSVFFSVAQKWQPIASKEDRFCADFLPNKLPLEDCLVSMALKLHISGVAAATQKFNESTTVSSSDIDMGNTIYGLNQPIRQPDVCRPEVSIIRLRKFMDAMCANVPAMEDRLRLFQEKLVEFEASTSDLRNEFHELVRDATGISIQ